LTLDKATEAVQLLQDQKMQYAASYSKAQKENKISHFNNNVSGKKKKANRKKLAKFTGR
jgi:hypothetical protein